MVSQKHFCCIVEKNSPDRGEFSLSLPPAETIVHKIVKFIVVKIVKKIVHSHLSIVVGISHPIAISRNFLLLLVPLPRISAFVGRLRQWVQRPMMCIRHQGKCSRGAPQPFPSNWCAGGWPLLRFQQFTPLLKSEFHGMGRGVAEFSNRQLFGLIKEERVIWKGKRMSHDCSEPGKQRFEPNVFGPVPTKLGPFAMTASILNSNLSAHYIYPSSE